MLLATNSCKILGKVLFAHLLSFVGSGSIVKNVCCSLSQEIRFLSVHRQQYWNCELILQSGEFILQYKLIISKTLSILLQVPFLFSLSVTVYKSQEFHYFLVWLGSYSQILNSEYLHKGRYVLKKQEQS